jgi:hypothetical protein
VIKLTQPPTTESKIGEQFADEPELWFSPFGGQAVQGNDQAAVLLHGLFQAVAVLLLLTREQREIDLWVQIPHVRFRNLKVSAQIGVNL